MTRSGRLLVAVCWVGALVFTVATYELTNDQFGRISPGWQIASFGDVPFKDFLDPGYFLTELTTAALQRLFGPQLLAEMLLNAVFIATGVVLVLRLAQRASGSAIVGLTAAAVALLSMPRAYDYDKVLLYPLGLFLIWRYIDRPDTRNLVWLGTGVAAAGLFRYDNGVFIGGAAVVALVAVHARDWPMFARRLVLLVATSVCAAAPFLVWIASQSGVADALDQMWTYAIREGARTRIESRPALRSGGLVDIPPADPAGVIQITWHASVGRAARLTLAERYQLRDEAPQGPPESRTWSYSVADPSPGNLRRLIDDPFAERTVAIDRDTATLIPPESLWHRVSRTIPVARARLLPGLRDRRNGSAFLYHLLTWLPVVAALIILVRHASTGDDARVERAHLAALLTLCLALNVFILRDPVGARIGGMAGPAAILFAWITGVLVRGWTGRVALVVVLACTVASLSTVAEWDRRLRFNESIVSRIARLTTALAATPPSIRMLPSADLAGLVSYLRECTAPTDRVFATSFLPDLYFFAQRGFAGGVVATFGGHWSEPRFEQRTVAALSSQSVPIVIVESGDVAGLAATYPALERHLRERYIRAGQSTFAASNARPYQLFAHRDRPVVRLHSRFSLPCFVP